MTTVNTKEKIKELLQVLSKPQQDNGNNVEDQNGSNPLSELSHLIRASNAEDLMSLLDEEELGPVFSSFHQNVHNVDLDVAEGQIEVFESLLGALPTKYIASHLQAELISGLKSNNARLQLVWLKALLKIDLEVLDKTGITRDYLQDVILRVVELLQGDVASSVPALCHKILHRVAPERTLVDIFSTEFTAKFKEVMEITDAVSLRVLSLMVDISAESSKLMNLVISAGYFDDLRDFAFGDDILVGLNHIQLMKDFASTPHGVEYLHLSGILRNVANHILSDDLPMANIVLPGYFALFGAVGKESPELLGREYRKVVEKLIEICGQNGNPALFSTALLTIGVIGRENAGKRVLDSFDNFEVVLRRLGSIITGSGEKTEALQNLAHLLEVEKEDPNGEATTTLDTWYAKLSDDRKKFTNSLIGICKTPFVEDRLAAMKILRILATHIWGVKDLASVENIVDYLTNRSTEFDKAGKEAKLEIVKTLSSSPFTAGVISGPDKLRLRKYVNEGAFYVDIAPSVAVEGE